MHQIQEFPIVFKFLEWQEKKKKFYSRKEASLYFHDI